MPNYFEKIYNSEVVIIYSLWIFTLDVDKILHKAFSYPDGKYPIFPLNTLYEHFNLFFQQIAHFMINSTLHATVSPTAFTKLKTKENF